jgi:glutathione synthase/RimK-type ligase-like ATP-grasp enzyme
MTALVIGINKNVHSTKRIISELKKARIKYTFFKWGNLFFEGGMLKDRKKEIKIFDYDKYFFDVPSYALIEKTFPKNDATLIKAYNEYFLIIQKLKKSGKKIINGDFLLNNPFYNKFTQSVIFEREKIETIRTVHLVDNKYENVRQALGRSKITFPLVAKMSTGGMGLAVWKLENEKELKKFLIGKRSNNMVFQPFIKNDGDFRVLVCNGRSLGIMKRTAQKKEWRNNFFLGGKIERYEDQKMLRFAEEVCLRLDVDYAGIDIIKSGNKYLVVEANMFACFEGFEKVYPKINVAKKIISIF